MDIFSHGLRGGMAFGRKSKKKFWLSFAFGIFPDFAAFAIPFIVNIIYIIIGKVEFKVPPSHHIDFPWIHYIYSFTHSIIIWSTVFLLLWLIFRKPILACFARLIHIILDIFTHSLAFFATPFLWPISDWKFDGIPRSNPWIFFGNWGVIAILGGLLLYKKWKNKIKKSRK